MRRNVNKWGSLLVIGAAFLAAPAQGAVIYYESFSGSAGDDLSGKAPDVRPGAEVWIASASPTANVWKANGSIAQTGLNQHRSAYLPFVPEAGYIYTLSMDSNPTRLDSPGTGGSSWFALGFTPTNPTTTSWASSSVHGASGFGIIHRRNPEDTLGDAGSYGPGLPNIDVGDGIVRHDVGGTGWVNLKIVLDTTAAQWKASFYFDNVHYPDGDFTFATNPTDIQYVGFHNRWPLGGGSVDKFMLTVESPGSHDIPEPPSVVLILVGILAIAMRTRFTTRRTSRYEKS